MNKLAVRAAEGHNPTNEDGKPFEAGVEVELTPHVDNLLRCGLLVPDEGGEPPAGSGEREPETKEEWHSLYSKMKVDELKEALVSGDIEIPEKARKADLVELIMASHFPEGE